MSKKKFLIVCNICLFICFIVIALACASSSTAVGSGPDGQYGNPGDGAKIEKGINNMDEINIIDVANSNDEVA